MIQTQRLSEWITETITIAESRIGTGRGGNGNYYHGVRDFLKEIIGAVERLEAASDPWTNIDPERPETLPPYSEKIIITSKDGDVEAGYRKREKYRAREIDVISHENDDWTLLDDCIAWKLWPDPAPLPGE